MCRSNERVLWNSFVVSLRCNYWGLEGAETVCVDECRTFLLTL